MHLTKPFNKVPIMTAVGDFLFLFIYLFIYFFYFLEKMSLGISIESSDSHEMSRLIFAEKEKNTMLSASAVVSTL